MMARKKCAQAVRARRSCSYSSPESYLHCCNNPPIEIECGTEGEFDNARDASRRLFLNMFVLNLVTGHGALLDRKTMHRNNYAIRRSNAIFVISEMIHRATIFFFNLRVFIKE